MTRVQQNVEYLQEVQDQKFDEKEPPTGYKLHKNRLMRLMKPGSYNPRKSTFSRRDDSIKEMIESLKS